MTTKTMSYQAAPKTEGRGSGGSASPREVMCRIEPALTPEAAARFDGFTSASRYASYMQTTAWTDLAPTTRLHRFVFVTCEEAGRITVAGLARLTHLFPGRYLARFQRGPVFNETELFRRALPHILKELRAAGVCTVLMSPRWEDDGAREVEGIMTALGMRKLPRDQQPAHSTTGIVDLDRPEEEIIAGFQSRCRRDIRRAERKGLVVRPAETEEEADVARDRRRVLAEIRNMDELGQPDMVDQWRSFKGSEDGVLLLAEAQGSILGGLAVVREGQRAMARSGGTLPILPKLPRMHNLIWESMRIMKARGCREYDLAGLPDNASDVKEDERRREHFKLAFNPRIVRLVPIYCAALRPFEHAMLFTARQWYRRSPISRLIGPRLSRK
jgi:peptidoglycan pentaglycine glycine transferase (the first glycine)